MSIIEQKINKNKALFDVNDPIQGHSDRFRARLNKTHRKPVKHQKNWFPKPMKIAASIIVLMAVSFAFYTYNNGNVGLFASETTDKLTEVEDYYSSLTKQKLVEIDELSAGDEDAFALKENALKNVETMDIQTTQLKQDYLDSNKDTRVFGAIVSNYRLLASALDKVIENLNDVQDKKSGSI
ncbi:MAG: hypothetical protein GY834_03635 [Bacteroidetes bacterium]|nr:hypothetical protein [Bacteroidota bacterium]